MNTRKPSFLSDSNRRALGFSETVLQNRYVNAHGANNVGGILRVSGEIDTKKVKQVLSASMKKHPLLCARLSGFSVLAALEVDDNASNLPPPIEYSERKSEDSAKKHLEEIIDVPFPQDIPWLWECRLFRNNNPEGPHELVLKTHHLVMDGLSIASFLEEILHNYNADILEEVLDNYNADITETSKMPFLKPTEDLVTSNTSWAWFLLQDIWKTLWKACFEKSISNSFRQHACGQTLFSDRHTKISFASFDENDLTTLLNASKKNGTTLTALMTACLLLATREVCGKPDIEVIGTPISTRAYFDESVPAGDHLGIHIADTKVCLPITENMNVWDIAKAWKSELGKCLPVVYPAKFSPSLWKVALIGNASLSNAPRFTSGIGVSNLGNRNYMDQSFQQNHPGFLKFEDFYFCCSKRSGGKLMAIYTEQAGKKLELCFAHPDKLVTEIQAERIKTNTIERLQHVIEIYQKEILDMSANNFSINPRQRA